VDELKNDVQREFDRNGVHHELMPTPAFLHEPEVTEVDDHRNRPRILSTDPGRYPLALTLKRLELVLANRPQALVAA
jgi:hypothetical protein